MMDGSGNLVTDDVGDAVGIKVRRSSSAEALRDPVADADLDFCEGNADCAPAKLSYHSRGLM